MRRLAIRRASGVGSAGLRARNTQDGRLTLDQSRRDENDALIGAIEAERHFCFMYFWP